MPRSPRLAMTGDRGLLIGIDFENAVLIARQRPGKSASPSGRVHRQCMWSGSTTEASMWKAARTCTCRNRVPQRVNLGHQQIRVAVEQVHRKEECSTREPIAAIVRHEREHTSPRRVAEFAVLFRPTLAIPDAYGAQWN